MRTKILFLFLALTTVALAGDSSQTAATSAPGRYQLLSGTTCLLSEKAKVEMPVILKIDTQTGQTWMFTLFASSSASTNIIGFVPVVDFQTNAAAAKIK